LKYDLIECVILLSCGKDNNNIEMFELPLERMHPAKASQDWHHHQNKYSYNKHKREESRLLKTTTSLSESQLVSKTKATDKPPLLKMKSWSPLDQVIRA